METDLWQTTLFHLDKGNFTALEEALGGPHGFDEQLQKWHYEGRFDSESEALVEALTCSCMLGRTKTVQYLLDNGVDPLAGIKTGLNGFHYAVSGGRTDVVRLLIDHRVPMEVENMYGGTVLGQALWSAVNEFKPTHVTVIEMLLESGAAVGPGTTRWWREQQVPDENTRLRVLDALVRHGAI